MINISDIANRFSIPLMRGIRLRALFGITFLVQVVNTALRHGGKAGYWAYMLLLEGPVMLFNLLVIYKCQQLYAQWRQYPEYSAIIWSYGSLTMPPSETIAQDIELAAIVPLAALGLMFFWMIIYVLFEDGDEYFDDTFTDGVIMDELNSWDGVVYNIAAQSTWRCFMLFAAHLICPAFPMSAAAIYAGGLSKRMTTAKLASTLDLVGTGMAGILFLIGIYETIFDDNNGVGLYHLVNAAVLLIFTVPRVLQKVESDTPHVLMGRPCYHQSEPTKEQELSETQPEGDGTDEKTVV